MNGNDEEKSIPTGGDVNHLVERVLVHHGANALRIATNRAMHLGQIGDQGGALMWLEISNRILAIRRRERIPERS